MQWEQEGPPPRQLLWLVATPEAYTRLVCWLTNGLGSMGLERQRHTRHTHKGANMAYYQEDFESVAELAHGLRRVVLERARMPVGWLVRASLLDKYGKNVCVCSRVVLLRVPADSVEQTPCLRSCHRVRAA